MLNEVLHLFIDQHTFFFKLTLEHIGLSVISVLLATGLGLSIGMLISEQRNTSTFVLSLINVIYTIPSISMLGFLIPLSGIGNLTAVIALTVYALLPMVRNTYIGLTTIDPQLIEAAEGMGMTSRQMMLRIKLPLALPVIFSGLRNMVIMTIALAGIASFIGAGGLGVAVFRGITTNNQAMTIAGSLLIALLALLAEGVAIVVERFYKRYRARQIRQFERPSYTWKPFFAIGLVILLGIGVFQYQKEDTDTIHIATKPMTEQYILGHMLKMLIESKTDLNVDLTTGVGGGTNNIQPGMVDKSFDIYPEYTGTGWNMVLKKERRYHEELFPALTKAYADQFHFSWLGGYGFENTYCMLVRRDIAEKYQLKTISDVARYASQLSFGANYDFFERPDGMQGLQKMYGFQFGKTVDMDISLRYQALANQQVDVIMGYTTDALFSQADVVAVKDDKTYFPSYYCYNVVRDEVLTEHPDLEKVFMSTKNLLNNKEMSRLNYAVEVQKKSPKDVARQYLKDKQLI